MSPKRVNNNNNNRALKRVKRDEVPPELRALGVRSMDQSYLSLEIKDTNVPSAIGRMSKLQEIMIRGEVRTLPASFANLKGLKELSIWDGIFSSIPEVIFKLKNLESLVLEMKSTRLRSIPSSISNLVNLQELWVGNAQLRSLPKEIGELTKLEALILDKNKLTSLPDALANLKNLKTFTLHENDLRSVPSWVGDLTKLQKLEITRNPNLKRIPAKLRRRRGLYLYKDRWTRFDDENDLVGLSYKNFKLPNNGAMDAISYTNFNRGDQALRITNANRPPTYMSVNTFKRLSNAKTAQASEHIYKRNSDVRNINDVFSLNGNTNVFINPMTTKMVKRKDIDFVKFV